MTSRFPPSAFVELVSPYNKKSITRWLEEMNFMFSWQEHKISSRHRVISPIYTILNRKAMKPTTIFTKARCFKSFNEEAFDKDLECVPFNVAYIFDDVNDICWAWEKMYTNVLNGDAPIKSKRCRNAAGKSKFITPEIKKAM